MSAIPGRLKILTASWIFIAASVFLIAEFVLVGYGPRDTETAQLEGVLGALSCVGWFAGFAVLIDWIVFDTFTVWGFSRRALCGATLKLIAAVIFNIQPWSLLLDGDTNAVGYFDGRSGSANPSWWAPCQVIGASLLLAGSIIYAAWANLPPKDKMPLTDVLVQ